VTRHPLLLDELLEIACFTRRRTWTPSRESCVPGSPRTGATPSAA